MPQAGHVLIGNEGQLLDVDAAFCDIMRLGPEAICGRLVLDVTAPADRSECADAIAMLRATHRPFVIVKRFLRDDGSLVWVRNSVSITMYGSRSQTVVATVEPVEAPTFADSPAIQLDVARVMVAARRDRDMVCDPILFSDIGWDAVLAAYIAEAEGRALDTAGLSAALRHPPITVERWVKALLQHNVLEIEYRTPTANAPKAYRLTADTHRRLEAYLARVRPRYRELQMND